MKNARIVRIHNLNFQLGGWKWPFAERRRAEISAHFKLLKENNNALWNGRVFLLRDYQISNDTLRGEFFETDFASLIAWRDWGYPDSSVLACFAMTAIEACDGGFLLGVMGRHTANPGMAYFPTGTPDPADLDGQIVDLDKSVRRELKEETGLTFDRFSTEPGWYAVFSGRHLALIKRLSSVDKTAHDLRANVEAFLAAQARPEFVQVCIVRDRKDLSAAVPPYVQAFLIEAWK